MGSRTFAIKPKSTIALGASTTLFALYYKAPATILSAQLLEASLSTDQTTSSATRIRFDVCRLSTLGTWTTMTQPIKFDPDGPTIQGSFGHTCTGGGVAVNALDADEDDIPFTEWVLQGYTWRPPEALIIPIAGVIAIRAISTTNGANIFPRFVIREGM